MEMHIEVRGDVGKIIRVIQAVAEVTQATVNGRPVVLTNIEAGEPSSEVLPVSLVTDPEVEDAAPHDEQNTEAEAAEVQEEGVAVTGSGDDGSRDAAVEAASEEEAGS